MVYYIQTTEMVRTSTQEARNGQQEQSVPPSRLRQDLFATGGNPEGSRFAARRRAPLRGHRDADGPQVGQPPVRELQALREPAGRLLGEIDR